MPEPAVKKTTPPRKPSSQEGPRPERDDRQPRSRARTIPARRLTKAEIAEGLALADDMEYVRPRTRAECAGGVRPCPFVSCRYHLYLDVNPETGSFKKNFPDLEVWEMPQTCALDVAEQGGTTLEDVGHIMNLTRERIRQIEANGIDKLQQEGYALEARAVDALPSATRD
jgi:hypothetical protein